MKIENESAHIKIIESFEIIGSDLGLLLLELPVLCTISIILKIEHVERNSMLKNFTALKHIFRTKYGNY